MNFEKLEMETRVVENRGNIILNAFMAIQSLIIEGCGPDPL